MLPTSTLCVASSTAYATTSVNAGMVTSSSPVAMSQNRSVRSVGGDEAESVERVEFAPPGSSVGSS
ncbi:hypothetical protein [Halobaculum litoreum]|uniref:hypothetical protein n=1 Tax=Halobaculum litoreum TaxID=3031998 RepID=UPI0024C28927|nr:hypothetical protein [Halobaculum sp. DT92]